MYKALNRHSQEEIIILSPQWENRLDQLRSMDKEDILVCQGCQQPVRVRAGNMRRHHFAHKHLKGCSYGTESPDILEARAVLYRWLITKFPAGVTIEKRIPDSNLPRPIDCWVERKEDPLAYWIIDSGLQPDIREKIIYGVKPLGASVTWVFTSKMLRVDSRQEENCLLSTTEREFLKKSQFDEINFDGNRFWDSFMGRTIHYLDSENELLITYHSMTLVHPPNVYHGRKRVSPLSVVKVMPKTGEFVHPGEYEQFKALKEKFEREKEKQKNKAPLTTMIINNAGRNLNQSVVSKLEQPNAVDGPDCGICIYCGEETADHWYIFTDIDGIRKCKCRKCYAKGLY